MKKDYAIYALLAIGAALVLWLLFNEQSTAAAPVDANGEALPEPSAQVYPSVPPINLGNIDINDAANPAQTYNTPMDDYQLPTVQLGTPQSDCGCEDQSCEPAGVPVAVQTVPLEVMTAAVQNLNSFQTKVTAYTTSGANGAPSGGGGLSGT